MCSSSITIDTTPLSKPAPLVWQEGSSHTALSVTANWIQTAPPVEIASQTFQLYKGSTCSVTEDGLKTPSRTDSSRAVSVSGEGIFHYKVFITDFAGNTTASDCSPQIIVDTTMPEPVSAASWQGGPYELSSAVTATWTLGSSTDLINHRLNVYKDPACSVVEGTPTLVSASATTATHTVSADGDYYFTVTAIDAIGNETTISCSPTKITVDTVDPTPASELAWSEGSYHNDTSVTATWTVGGATDASSQELFVYSDAACTNQVGASFNINNATTSSQAISLASVGDWYFKLVTTDNAARTSDSGCSAAITVDNIAPSQATSLAGDEGSYHTTTNVNISWTSNYLADGDVASQQIQVYSDASCTTTDGAAITGLAKEDQTRALSLSGAGTFSYQIKTIDLASNESLSSCSAPITIDLTDPTVPNSVAVVADYYNCNSMDVSFNLGSDTNLLQHNAKLCENSDCNTDCLGSFPRPHLLLA